MYMHVPRLMCYYLTNRVGNTRDTHFKLAARIHFGWRYMETTVGGTREAASAHDEDIS